MDVAFAAENNLIKVKIGSVSILVVMDVAFAEFRVTKREEIASLNPCCNGCCFRSIPSFSLYLKKLHVSILVVMDVALAAEDSTEEKLNSLSQSLL